MTQEQSTPDSTAPSELSVATAPSNQWNDARWRTLIGFSSPSTAATTSSDEQSDEYEDDDEYEEDAEDVEGNESDVEGEVAPEKTPAFKNPIYQAGVVGAIALVVFGTAGAFLNGFGNNSDQQASTPSPSPSPTNVPFAQDPTNPADQNTSGALKTEVALGRQEKELQAINARSRNPQQSRSQQPTGTNQTSAPKVSPPIRSTIPPPQPVAQINQTPTPPQIIRSTPIPRDPSVVAPRLSTSVTTNPQPKQEASKPAVDPEELWNRLARTGSYGQSATSAANSTNSARSMSRDPAVTEAPARSVNSSVETSPVSPNPVLPRMANVPSEIAPPEILPIPTYPSSGTTDVADNTRTTNAVQPRFLMVGSTATAMLDTPVVVLDNGGNANFTQKYIVSLSQPLLDAEGFIALPQGAKIVAVVTAGSTGGFVQLDGVSVLHNGQEYAIPSGTIVISGNQGNPLQARRLRDGEQNQLGRDLLAVGAKAVAEAGSELTRPQTSTSVTSGSSGNIFSSTTTSGDRNVLGAVLRGGLGELSDRIEARSNQQPQETRINAWVVDKGQPVQIFINRAIQLP